MHRRAFLTGAAALAAYAQIDSAEALTSAQRDLLLTRQAFTATGLPRWQAAARKVIAGSANTTILMVGDSTTRTAPSYSTPTWGINAVPPILQGLLTSTVKSSCNNFLGSGGLTGNIGTTTDSRITQGGWSATGSNAIGGPTWLATAANTFTFTPEDSTGAQIAFDTIEIRYDQISGFGSFSVNVDGGATLATINTSGTNGPAMATISCPLGTHIVNIVWVSGTVVFVGPNCYNSATKQVSILNAGWGGSKSGDWNVSAAAYQPIGWVGRTDHVLTAINLGINDWETGVATATYSTNIQAMITAGKLAGDVLLVTPNTTNGSASIATQATYVSVLQGLATSNSVKLLDLWTNTFGGAVQPSLMFNTLHPNTAGIAAIAAAYKTALTT